MIRSWCIKCLSSKCAVEASHRAQQLIKYRADFTLGGRFGKRIRKFFSNKKDAEAFQYITLADYKRGLFIPSNTSKVTFEEFFKEYSEKKIKRYMRGSASEIYRLGAFKNMFSNYPMSVFKPTDWDKYVTERLKGKEAVGQTTLNRDLTAVKTMFKWATENGYLKENPFRTSKKFKVENVRVRWLDDKEIDSVLQNCVAQGDLDMRDILVCALYTGFRKANLKQITAHDVLGQKIQATRTKSGKVYEVPINKNLAEVLTHLIRRNKTGPLLNFKNFRLRFNACVKDKTVTLHTFRHTFAAQCLKRGIPIDRVCKWLGHHSVEFTRSHYGHLCPNQEQIEIDLLNLTERPHKESNLNLQSESLPS